MKKLICLLFALTFMTQAICSRWDSIDSSTKHIANTKYRELIIKAAESTLSCKGLLECPKERTITKFMLFLNKFANPAQPTDKLCPRQYADLLEYIKKLKSFSFKVDCLEFNPEAHKLTTYKDETEITLQDLAMIDLMGGLGILQRNAFNGGLNDCCEPLKSKL